MIAKRERIITLRIFAHLRNLRVTPRFSARAAAANLRRMFEKGMEKSIKAYLEPGEELLSANIVQGKGLGKVALAGGVFTAMAVASSRDKKAAAAESDDEVRLSSKMGLAITSRRLMIFKAGGSMTLSAKELLSAIPIGAVDAIDIGKGVVTKPLTSPVRGESFPVAAPRAANTDKLLEAFAQAKGSSAAAA
jgi:hypothetical protein